MKRATTQEIENKKVLEKCGLNMDDINKFKRYIYSKSPQTVQKRKKYSEEEKVKERRSELNKERRYLCAILIRMLKNGDLKNSQGDKLSFLNNRCIQQDTKEVYTLDSKKNIKKEKYEDEISLLSVSYNPPLPLKNKPGIKFLLKKFAEGDPEILELVSKKRVVAETINRDIEDIRRLVQEELNSESDESE